MNALLSASVNLVDKEIAIFGEHWDGLQARHNVVSELHMLHVALRNLHLVSIVEYRELTIGHQRPQMQTRHYQSAQSESDFVDVRISPIETCLQVVYAWQITNRIVA